MDVTGEQWDGVAKRTPFGVSWDSGPKAAARGHRWFTTSTETVQLPATVRPRHPSLFCPPHILPAISQDPGLSLFDFHHFPLPFSLYTFFNVSVWLQSQSPQKPPFQPPHLQTFKWFWAKLFDWNHLMWSLEIVWLMLILPLSQCWPWGSGDFVTGTTLSDSSTVMNGSSIMLLKEVFSWQSFTSLGPEL